MLATKGGHVFINISSSIEAAQDWLLHEWPNILPAIVWVGIGACIAGLTYLALSRLRDFVVCTFSSGNEERRTWRAILGLAIARTWRLSLAVLAVSVAAALLGIWPSWLQAVAAATLTLQAGLWLGSVLQELTLRQAGRSVGDRSAIAGATSLIQALISIMVWSIVALVLLGNLGIDVTALVAGLGIGGIAIGLAAQSIFSDLFASLSIALDRPFVRGDFVVFGNHMGTIERIGVKSTRLRSLSGEQIVVSNANLLQATIKNYQLLHERRVLFTLNLVYRTSNESLAAIPEIVRDVVVSVGKTRFDRCHLKELGNFSLAFETVYFVIDPDYNVYMDVQHQINLAIMRAFSARGIEFAFPTQSVFLEGLNLRAPSSTSVREAAILESSVEVIR